MFLCVFMLSEINLLCFSGAKLNKRFEIACISSKKRQKKLHIYLSLKKKTAKQSCAMPFSLVYQLYLNYLSFVSHSYIFHNTITYKWENARKDLTTSLFVSKPQYLLGFSQGRCLANRSLNTSPNTSLFSLFCIWTLFTLRNRLPIEDRDIKKVTCWVRCWVRSLQNTSLSELLVNKGVSEW